MNLNTTDQRIVEAVERGYYMTKDGQLFSKRGAVKIALHGSQRYPTFTTNWGGKVYGLPIHKFAAYFFYGEKAFDKNYVVRHLNGDTCDLRKSNIVLGTHSENNLDKPPEIRKAAAIKARASQLWSGFNKGKKKNVN